jgi:secondary thiamine-phosphate synthase enzyme
MFAMLEIRIKSTQRVEARNITGEVAEAVRGQPGNLVHVYVPHTTCGLLINEDADPNVMKDILEALDRLVPGNLSYRHMEGNSDAHIKSSLVGHSCMVPFSGGSLSLGTWQGIFLMEFDGPRDRRVSITIV